MMINPQESKPIFRLEDIIIEPPETAIPTPENRKSIKTKEVEVDFKNNTLKLLIEKTSMLAATDDRTVDYIIVSALCDNECLSTLEIDTEMEQGKYIGTTTVYNNEKASKKITGLGTALWQTGQRFMQTLADNQNTPVTHQVVKYPSNGLTEEKWNKIFLPLLTGYEKKGKKTIGEQECDYWEKEYNPR